MLNINELDQERIDEALNAFFEKRKVIKIDNPTLLPYESTDYELALLQIFDIIINSKDSSETLDDIVSVLLENINMTEPIFVETLRNMGNGISYDEDGVTHLLSRSEFRKKSVSNENY